MPKADLPKRARWMFVDEGGVPDGAERFDDPMVVGIAKKWFEIAEATVGLPDIEFAWALGIRIIGDARSGSPTPMLLNLASLAAGYRVSMKARILNDGPTAERTVLVRLFQE
jgi:hypothetical protein